MLKPSQSSIFKGQDAIRALDGKLSGTGTRDGGCAMTEEKEKNHDKHWWKAEFEENHVITSVKIMPRYNCCQNRYTHVTVDTSIDGNTWTLCVDLGDTLKTAVKGSWVDAKCVTPAVAKYVKITLYNKEQFSLCEVEAWGYKSGVYCYFFMFLE